MEKKTIILKQDLINIIKTKAISAYSVSIHNNLMLIHKENKFYTISF